LNRERPSKQWEGKTPLEVAQLYKKNEVADIMNKWQAKKQEKKQRQDQILSQPLPDLSNKEKSNSIRKLTTSMEVVTKSPPLKVEENTPTMKIDEERNYVYGYYDHNKDELFTNYKKHDSNYDNTESKYEDNENKEEVTIDQIVDEAKSKSKNVDDENWMFHMEDSEDLTADWNQRQYMIQLEFPYRI
jgi:hypothetical protein